MRILNIDVETFSTVDIKSGVSKYCTGAELLLLSYSLDSKPVRCIDVAQGEEIPKEFMDALFDENVLKTAWNAAFEIEILELHFGVPMKLAQWSCTMVMAARCGYPLSLDKAAKAIGLPIEKDTAGKALIRLFSVPRKPTKTNPAVRVYPQDSPEKWEDYKAYNIRDVEVEMEARKFFLQYPAQPHFEHVMYVLDRTINKRGLEIDVEFVRSAIKMDEEYKDRLLQQAKELTGLDNPNSVAQLKEWFGERGLEVDSLNKESLKEYLVLAEQGFVDTPIIEKEAIIGYESREIHESDKVLQMLRLRKELSNTSVKKYVAMLNSEVGGRVYDTIQFNGAGRTGRNAGRIIQPQNMPRVYLEDSELDLARRIVKYGNLATVEMCFESVSGTLSQLIRTAISSKEGKHLKVVDLSAIEARVLAWLANEEHVLEVFRTHGKIYEATAAMMFKVPFDSIKKGSVMRQRGKVSSLACIGFGELVLTDSGLVPIQEVQLHHKLWDGEEWVSHGGVIYKGIQIVNERHGLCATDDHVVWVHGENTPVRFADLHKYKGLRRTAIGTDPIHFDSDPLIIGSIKGTIGGYPFPVFDIVNAGPRNRFTVSGVLVHNCGYQGGANAITTMDLDKSIPDEEKPGLVKAWRDAHPNIVRYWYSTQNAAIKAIKNPGEKVPLSKGAYFVVHKDALLFYLPSGRYLMYPKVGLEEGKYGEKIVFWGLDQITGQWKKQDTYSGKLVENLVQGVARDVLMEGMLGMVRAGYDLVTNVHDETVAETDINFGSINEIKKLMCTMPAWADGLPLAAEGFESDYYKK